MVAVEDVIASLPRERQKKIAVRGNELLEKVQRRMTLSQIRGHKTLDIRRHRPYTSLCGIRLAQISCFRSAYVGGAC
jgi:hypothetical protein